MLKTCSTIVITIGCLGLTMSALAMKQMADTDVTTSLPSSVKALQTVVLTPKILKDIVQLNQAQAGVKDKTLKAENKVWRTSWKKENAAQVRAKVLSNDLSKSLADTVQAHVEYENIAVVGEKAALLGSAKPVKSYWYGQTAAWREVKKGAAFYQARQRAGKKSDKQWQQISIPVKIQGKFAGMVQANVWQNAK